MYPSTIHTVGIVKRMHDFWVLWTFKNHLIKQKNQDEYIGNIVIMLFLYYVKPNV